MNRQRAGRTVVGFGIMAAALTIACTETVGTPAFDSARMRAYLQRNYPHAPSIIDGIARLVRAASGEDPPGVVYTRTAAGIAGAVTVDVKGDGTDSATAQVTLDWIDPTVGLSGGGLLTIRRIDNFKLSGSATARLGPTADGSSIQFTAVTAAFHYPVGPTLNVTRADLTVTISPSRRLILGSADFRVGTTAGTLYFEGDGAGGWRVRVVSPDFAAFVVP